MGKAIDRAKTMIPSNIELQQAILRNIHEFFDTGKSCEWLGQGGASSAGLRNLMARNTALGGIPFSLPRVARHPSYTLSPFCLVMEREAL